MKKILIPLFILLLATNVLALEYSVTVSSPSSVNAYEGDKISNKFSATITNSGGVCDITCGWATTAGQGSGIKVAHDGGTNTFNFDVNADGSGGTASYSLITTCDRISAWNCWSDEDQRTLGPYQFRFLWNGVCESQKGENCVTSPNDCRCKFNEKCNRETKSCEIILCGDGKCDSGENSLSCPNDCKEKYSQVFLDSNIDFPVIFIHGHSPSEVKGYSPTSLEEFQDKLAEQGYEDMGIMLPSDYPPKLTKGIWSGKKVSVIMTYYANKYDKLGGVVGPDDNQRITTYSQRLRDVVEVVKHNTGKNKVIIIAHSMGGLVSRSYIKYYGGLDSVDKLVTIGTPNHGTYGAVAFGCDTILAGRNPTPECEDMNANSDFLIKLNANDETPSNIKYLTIIGKNKKLDSCPDKGYTDNVICAASVYLYGAENYYYDDFSPNYSLTNSLHTAFVSPSKAPDVYNKIISFLKS